MFGQWYKTIRERFADRENLGEAGVYEQYWAEFPEHLVMEFFELIEVEYQLPPGLLRPDDRVTKLLDPVKPTNSLKWLFYQTHTEDSASELSFQLGKRERAYGIQDAWNTSEIVSVNDALRAWCGQFPDEK